VYIYSLFLETFFLHFFVFLARVCVYKSALLIKTTRPSVRLSVWHTRMPRPNGSRDRNTFHTVSFMASNFVVLSLWSTPCRQRNL